jgi:hypothetical protein
MLNAGPIHSTAPGASRRILGVILASVALLPSVGCVPYRKSAFMGPATVADSGMFSYYRYHFRFSPALPLDKPSTQTYIFRGLPGDEMVIQFKVESREPLDGPLLETLDSNLSVALRDDLGNILCSGSGKLSEARLSVGGPDDDHWVLEHGGGIGGSAEYWRPSCTSMKFGKGRTFTLLLTLDNIDPRSPPNTSIRPIIEGGGTELP